MKWIMLGDEFINMADVMKVTVSKDGRTATLWFSQEVSFDVKGALAAELIAWLEGVSLGTFAAGAMR